MANALYDTGREGFLDGSIDFDTDNIKVVAVDTAQYTVAITTHRFLSDIPVGARVATSSNLTGKTVAGGVADASDITINSVSGPTVEAVVIYKDTGTATTSRLIAYIDTATGLPLTPNGSNVTIGWDNNINRIFRI